jgi:hypothetical protein
MFTDLWGFPSVLPDSLYDGDGEQTEGWGSCQGGGGGVPVREAMVGDGSVQWF